ncbi:MAG: sarcosine oxidase subunit alpha family protein [Pseudomonadota bacterium]
MKAHRISGGLIDRTKPLTFSFNHERYQGFEGDTLASALVANGIKLVGRSFKYHRPRGIFSAGSEEPNALFQIGHEAHQEPNCRGTVTELYDGLEATSQNHLGFLSHDLLAVNDLLSPFLSAGFYYKTFMWPKSFWEKLYEPVIRSAAGLGALSKRPDPDVYDKGYLHCDLLVIGAGPAGLWAALNAARAGARVIIADEDFLSGGRLNSERFEVDGMPGTAWASKIAEELQAQDNVRFMTRTTVFGSYDHGIYGALERKTDHLLESNGKPRQVLWRIYSKRSLLCSGAIERPIAFGNNDRPGIMLAGAARTYLTRYAAVPGQSVAVFTNNDDGWQTAFDFAEAGIEVKAVIDTRSDCRKIAPEGAMPFYGDQVIDTKGRKGVNLALLKSGAGVECDFLAVSGGWNPALHLTCHQRGKPQWNEAINAFIPSPDLPKGMSVAGAANGSLTLSAALEEANKEAHAISEDLGFKTKSSPAPTASDEAYEGAPFWYVADSKSRAFVDLQNDVTSKDIALAHQEGFRSVEHLKRYTTMGMATDQGKTSNILGLAISAHYTGKTIPETGTTIFRPPYTPVPIGAFAGRSRGKDFRPTRLTPSHQWASKNGASFVETGLWLRAEWYVKPGEKGWRDSVDREAKAVREGVGICDVTTLGKIDIQGRDAGTFLDKVYTNTFSTLAVGKVRYGLMLREDGLAMDDGTTARLGETHFVMTTTTANAVLVYRHLEFCRQCLFPDLDVHLISTTEEWAQFAVAGPKSRALLEKIADNPADLSNGAFPFMACGEIAICGGLKARLFRISFSGELAYEIAVPRRYGHALFERLIKDGKAFGVVPYGTEALNVLRIEKGHATANEICGQVGAQALGLGKMLSSKKDFIGKTLGKRPGIAETDLRLAGFRPLDRNRILTAGAHFISNGQTASLENDEGWMTSVAYSPGLGYSIGLGFIKNGDKRIGEIVTAFDAVRDNSMDVEIVSPHFVDPEGERLRG